MRLKKFEEYEDINEEISLNPKNWGKKGTGPIDSMLKKLFTYMKNNFSYNFFKYDNSHSGPRGTLHYYEYKTDEVTIKIARDGTKLYLDNDEVDVDLYGSGIYDDIVKFLRKKSIEKEKENSNVEKDDKLTNFKKKYSGYFD